MLDFFYNLVVFTGILGNLNSFVLGSVIRPKRNHQQSPYPLGVCNQTKETRVQKRTLENVLSSCTKRWLCNSGHTHTITGISDTSQLQRDVSDPQHLQT